MDHHEASSSVSEINIMRSSFFALVFILWITSIGNSTDIINWNAPQQISGESDVSLTGLAVRAYIFNNAGPSTVINGVTFSEFMNQSSDISTFTYIGSGVFGSTQAPYSTMAIAYKNILSTGFYNLAGGTTASLTLNGLTTGVLYQIQVWVNDSRTISRNESINNSPNFEYNTTGVDGGLGQFMIGTFTANGTGSLTLDFTLPNGGDVQINGLQLRNITPVPEPSSFALGAVAFGIMAFAARRRHRRQDSTV